MLRIRTYYALKPFLPWRLRIGLRRLLARRNREAYKDVWPILPGSETPPPNWPGWPDGKKFAFVLTHDVEGRKGVERCRQLMELERDLGFRSSFNLVPEGECPIPHELRSELTRNGFEVGIHDLNHDGRLFFSQKNFQERAKRINHYLKEWNCRGFRAAYMHHQTDWMHELELLYDASTFDTDPFEPQPDGVGTIFPFYVPGHNRSRGFVELPYTLVQDFNLFIVLREKGVGIWDKKLAWIAANGGMAMLDTHPDYMTPKGSAAGRDEYPIELYESFLKDLAKKYAGQYWHALPHEVASFWLEKVVDKAAPRTSEL
jgi:hypothetical protein